MYDEIYFDMDGVLVDLSKHLAKLDGYDDPVLWFLHKSENDGKYTFPKCVERHIDDNCFSDCPPMPYYDEMKKLIRFLFSKGYKISILSSCMDQPYSDKIIRQKTEWLQKYYAEEFHMFNSINIVRGSKLKIKYIGEKALLIDDYLKTQKTFIENGMGDQFVSYKNFNDLIEQLIEKDII